MDSVCLNKYVSKYISKINDFYAAPDLTYDFYAAS